MRNLIGGNKGGLSGGGLEVFLSGVEGDLIREMKNIFSLAPLCKVGADEVNTLSFAPLRKGGVSRRLTGGLIASV